MSGSCGVRSQGSNVPSQPGTMAAMKQCDITWYIHTANLKQVKAHSCLSCKALHDTVLACTIHLTNNKSLQCSTSHNRSISSTNPSS